MFDVETIQKKLAEYNYFCPDDLGLIVSLAIKLQKPILLEGPAGVGKTELARMMAKVFDMKFIRLQCYEGLDEHHALYEWNYQKQLLYLQQTSQNSNSWNNVEKDIFSSEFLLPRPLLKAFQSKKQVVLLIDEIDKSDEEFESFLLESLSDFAVTIPEWGTVTANTIPIVFLTSNGARDFSDGLKRRCVHFFIDYPKYDQELAIIKAKVPDISDKLAAEVAQFVQNIRLNKLKKKPSIAETLDWAKVLVALGIENLEDGNPKLNSTYNFLLKYEQDLKIVINK